MKSGTPTSENTVGAKRRSVRNSKGQFTKKTRNSPATEFKKGDIPFNKGMKQEEWMSPSAIERTKATRFKKGQIPPNIKPLGHVRKSPHHRNGEMVGWDWFINIDWRGNRHVNYNYRKYIWESFHGEDAPKGMIFVAKDGDQGKTPTIGNIEMISRAEHMMRNNPRL